MARWAYLLHPPRDNFAATLTDEEKAAFQAHFEWLDRLSDEGCLLMVGITGGPINTGIGIFEADNEESAREIVSKDPVSAGGYARGDLRPFDLVLLRGLEEV
jgi:uncharacterized protein YciI